jgi:hypothetical protein
MDLHDQYEKAYKERPHVVILGAGASVATIPNGDKNGLKTSVMDGFLEKLGMQEIIENLNLNTQSNNLEDIYSELYENEDFADIRDELDKRIRNYFNQFQIPDNPTIYDFLILSLRKKDLIATFNWDPLLPQAYMRVSKITNELPQLAFLHGNVMIGYCEIDRIEGEINQPCPICNLPLTPSRLLYPIKQKDYNKDPYTKANWNKLKRFLSNAYLVTIFGYSAPKSDIEAIDMIKEAWGDIEKRNMEDFEFIDIKSEDEIINTWDKFIHTHHYTLTNNFFNSVLAKFPRRTTEELFDRTQNVKWLFPNEKTKFSTTLTFDDLTKIINNLVDEEYKFKDTYITLEGA